MTEVPALAQKERRHVTGVLKRVALAIGRRRQLARMRLGLAATSAPAPATVTFGLFLVAVRGLVTVCAVRFRLAGVGLGLRRFAL